MSFTSSESAIQYVDAETGEEIEPVVWVQEARTGETINKLVNVKNVTPFNVQLLNPRTTDPKLQIISYPNEVLTPGATGVMKVEYEVPQDTVTPPNAIWEFDVAVWTIG